MIRQASSQGSLLISRLLCLPAERRLRETIQVYGVDLFSINQDPGLVIGFLIEPVSNCNSLIPCMAEPIIMVSTVEKRGSSDMFLQRKDERGQRVKGGILQFSLPC